MPLVELEINLRIDGLPAQGFPALRRTYPNEVGVRKVVLPPGGTTYVIFSSLAIENGIIIQTDTAINLSLNNSGSVVPVPLNAGGILCIIDCNVTVGANYNVLVNNPNTSRTVNDGVLTAGSPTVSSATANFTSSDIGKTISGPNIPFGTTIIAVTNSTTATMSANAQSSASGNSLTIGTAQSATILFMEMGP